MLTSNLLDGRGLDVVWSDPHYYIKAALSCKLWKLKLLCTFPFGVLWYNADG